MKRRISRFLFAVTIAATLSALAPPRAEAGCLQQSVDCMDRASQLATTFQRSIAGVDCLIQLIGCVRRALGF
jgi:hypothetical protein